MTWAQVTRKIFRADARYVVRWCCRLVFSARVTASSMAVSSALSLQCNQVSPWCCSRLRECRILENRRPQACSRRREIAHSSWDFVERGKGSCPFAAATSFSLCPSWACFWEWRGRSRGHGRCLDRCATTTLVQLYCVGRCMVIVYSTLYRRKLECSVGDMTFRLTNFFGARNGERRTGRLERRCCRLALCFFCCSFLFSSVLEKLVPSVFFLSVTRCCPSGAASPFRPPNWCSLSPCLFPIAVFGAPFGVNYIFLVSWGAFLESNK